MELLEILERKELIGLVTVRRKRLKKLVNRLIVYMFIF